MIVGEDKDPIAVQGRRGGLVVGEEGCHRREDERVLSGSRRYRFGSVRRAFRFFCCGRFLFRAALAVLCSSEVAKIAFKKAWISGPSGSFAKASLNAGVAFAAMTRITPGVLA
jgi:hypothetical protein